MYLILNNNNTDILQVKLNGILPITSMIKTGIKSSYGHIIITKNTTLKWFQYRINHRILATNEFLHKIKILNSPRMLSFAKNILNL